MNKMLINATQRDELRVAITHDGLLIDLDIEHADQQQRQSNIYKGIITSIEPHLDAVFINYGSEKHGFLPLKEISNEYFISQPEGNPSKGNIRKLLKEGQEVVVQVEKDERGTKGAALTTFISIAGSYLVLMPNRANAGGVSRRIEGGEREQLREIINQLDVPDGMSVIARTAGVGRNNEELQWDLQVLLRYWEAIKQAAVAKQGPYLIHQESDVIIRAIRDYLRQDIDEIIIDEQSAYDRAHAYLNQIRPDFLPNLKLYSDHFPLFSRFQVEQQIENAYQHEVQLPSGGSIVIDHTEALVAIDINSARATKGGNIEETAFHTNKEAAKEIARQMRIRDIGGLIVIDFIDMTASSHQREVENILRSSMKMDRARIQIGRISKFGLLELSRQRIRSALVKITQNTCLWCSGRGSIRSVESLALSIIHLIQEHAAKTSVGQLQVQLPVDTATYILNEKRDVLQSIKEHSTLSIVIIPNEHMKSPNYDLKVIPSQKQSTIASYKLVNIPKAEQPTKRSEKYQESKEPAINQFLSTPETGKYGASTSKKSHEGVIKRLWGFMFGTEEPAKPAAASKSKNRGTSPKTQTRSSGGTQDQRDNTSARRGNRGGSRSSAANKSGANQQRKPAQQKTSKQNPRPSDQRNKNQTDKSPRPTAKKPNDKQQPAKSPAKAANKQPTTAAIKEGTNKTTTEQKTNKTTTQKSSDRQLPVQTKAPDTPKETASIATTNVASTTAPAKPAAAKPAAAKPAAAKPAAAKPAAAKPAAAKQAQKSRLDAASNLQQVKTKRNKPDSESTGKAKDDTTSS